MSALIELIGGNFQDAQGNLLANGYLTMTLSQDEEVNDSLICSGVTITIQLDANGNAVTGQFVWGNDQMSPSNSFYKVTGYTQAGQPAWGSNNQQVLGSGGTFDLGSWVPNQVIVWTPASLPPSFPSPYSPTSNAAGVSGQMAYDANYLYVCISSGVWKRVALTGGY